MGTGFSGTERMYRSKRVKETINLAAVREYGGLQAARRWPLRTAFIRTSFPLLLLSIFFVCDCGGRVLSLCSPVLPGFFVTGLGRRVFAGRTCCAGDAGSVADGWGSCSGMSRGWCARYDTTGRYGLPSKPLKNVPVSCPTILAPLRTCDTGRDSRPEWCPAERFLSGRHGRQRTACGKPV